MLSEWESVESTWSAHPECHALYLCPLAAVFVFQCLPWVGVATASSPNDPHRLGLHTCLPSTHQPCSMSTLVFFLPRIIVSSTLVGLALGRCSQLDVCSNGVICFSTCVFDLCLQDHQPALPPCQTPTQPTLPVPFVCHCPLPSAISQALHLSGPYLPPFLSLCCAIGSTTATPETERGLSLCFGCILLAWESSCHPKEL